SAWNAGLQTGTAVLRTAHLATLFGLAVSPGTCHWDMFLPEDALLRHVPGLADFATATCSIPETGQCDM
ncbi:MAG: hypothetical protein OXH05_06510, partial [Acidobacteria bacterium]|nr:hypothetical protein [Acidobacteriota bacterium]